jgi:bisphosphoglycerate-dependent phosphoglycerate mutase
MANRQLVLWRHGRTSWNLEQRFQGQTDIPLDEVGEQQAISAAQLLKHLNPSYIASSDLSRANKTGLELAKLLKLEVFKDEQFRPTWLSLGIISNCCWIVLNEPAEKDLPWRLVEYNAGSLPTPALSDDR